MAISLAARLTVLVGVCVIDGVAATAVGQQELLRRKTQARAGTMNRPGIGPGEGPSSGVLYREVHWEFWWFLNRESLLQLRGRLSGTASALGDGGELSGGGRRIPESDLPGVAQAFARAARESDPGLKAAALMALAKTGLHAYAPLIEGATEEGSLQVRRTATLALGILQAPGSAAPLEALILEGDQPAEICLYAAVGLALSGGLESRHAFLRLLEPRFFTRLESARAQALALAVGITREPALSTPVKVLLRGRPEPDQFTRAFLVLSLGRLGNASNRELLETYLDDESPWYAGQQPWAWVFSLRRAPLRRQSRSSSAGCKWRTSPPPASSSCCPWDGSVVLRLRKLWSACWAGRRARATTGIPETPARRSRTSPPSHSG